LLEPYVLELLQIYDHFAEDMLEDTNNCCVRRGVLEILTRLSAESLSPHVKALQTVLARDVNEKVTEMAMHILIKLDAASLVPHMDVRLLLIRHDHLKVRCYAHMLLARQGAEMLGQHAQAVLDVAAGDEDERMRELAFATLGTLGPARLAEHVPALLGGLCDAFQPVRDSAVAALRWLCADSLAPHVPALLDAVQGLPTGVRNAALESLGQLYPVVLA